MMQVRKRNSVWFDKKFAKKDLDNYFYNEYAKNPSTADLADLFNFKFNQSHSCFKKEMGQLGITQSTYLFLEKFKGIEGLIYFLKSSYGNIKMKTNLRVSQKVPSFAKFVGQPTYGILDDKEDKKWRVKVYGTNKYPHKKTRGIFHLIYDGLRDQMIKILMATSILSMIVEWVYDSLKDGGWISSVSFMTTCLMIVVLSSLSSYNCQSKLIKLEEEANE